MAATRNPGAGASAAGASRLVTQAADKPKHNAPSLPLQRQAEALHQRGPRPLGELLAEVLERLDADEADWLRRRLERYNAIPPETYRAVGADTFPPLPIREVS
ncbi:hypothetical protein [Ferruginivarius sediminum]|uniref:Uncharacterized protein n=1 Tax=Ferruginivarius sediminum TaxID=2661937 RepID=A0A369TBB7_9PROT|nr:hypothetical protein [Ferruginivarius sediminum]RDD62631.1 hypothetical protein DRB17_05575 [Ferruginivarius sediminum]